MLISGREHFLTDYPEEGTVLDKSNPLFVWEVGHYGALDKFIGFMF